ncbi:MOSC domain-containing protein [Tateyamaria sp. SN6-1]|uniref:MOSC domain-containing protein n=1 Tax=Tateyamaria sp. SN6-1 TaxID=3092148 RepID=UPI0039F5AB2C
MQVTELWRHPIKSFGRERIASVDLVAGESMPWDRVWAVAHEASKAEPGQWASCHSFTRIAQTPALMAVTATLDEATETVTLRHPDRPDLTVHPDTNGSDIVAWTNALMPENRVMPSHIMRLDGRGYTDSDFASVTLCNHASHRAVETQMQHALSLHRWRGNIWFDSDTPWIEFDWMHRDIKIGNAILRPRERTDRCVATTSNPETGRRDADVLAALDSFGHQDFSVRCDVIQGGRIQADDKVTPL